MPRTVKFTLRLDSKLVSQLDAHRRSFRRSRNTEIILLLESALKKVSRNGNHD